MGSVDVFYIFTITVKQDVLLRATLQYCPTFVYCNIAILIHTQIALSNFQPTQTNCKLKSTKDL